MDKMIKTAKNLNIMARAAFWTCIVCAGLLTVAVIVTMFLDDAAFGNATTSLILGPVSLELANDATPSPDMVRLRIVSGFFIIIPLVFFACMVLRVIRNILEPMSKGQPFSNTVSKDLHRLAVISLVAGAFYEISLAIHTMVTFGNFRLDQLFNYGLVSNITVEYKINLWFIVIFVILQLMSYVFKYGEELQQLSDETL